MRPVVIGIQSQSRPILTDLCVWIALVPECLAEVHVRMLVTVAANHADCHEVSNSASRLTARLIASRKTPFAQLLTEGFQVRVLAEEPIPSMGYPSQPFGPPETVPNFVPH